MYSLRQNCWPTTTYIKKDGKFQAEWRNKKWDKEREADLCTKNHRFNSCIVGGDFLSHARYMLITLFLNYNRWWASFYIQDIATYS